MHKYRGKTVTFDKPLFPGYVFLQLLPDQTQEVKQNDHVARLLVVYDQELFIRQLGDVLQALDTELEYAWLPKLDRESA